MSAACSGGGGGGGGLPDGGGAVGGSGNFGNFGGAGNVAGAGAAGGFGGTGAGGFGGTGAGGFGGTGAGGFGGTGAGGFGGTGAGGTGAGGFGGTGAGGSGGTGGITNFNLGTACSSNAQCGAGLYCLLPSSKDLDGKGAPKGLCTADCSSSATVCDAFGNNTICLEYPNQKSICIEGCNFGPTTLTQFSPNKCRGRQELACAPFFDAQSNFIGAGCVTNCNANSDCGPGLYCDPSDGACTSTPPTGLPLGSSCTQPSPGGNDACKGNCTSLQGTGSQTTVCTEVCTMGAVPQCGWSGPGTTADAFCLYSATVISQNGGPGVGDRGSCGQLCDCNSQCANPSMVCSAFAGTPASDLENLTSRKGYCTLDGPGITSCF
jgi:hypothetical protein